MWIQYVKDQSCYRLWGKYDNGLYSEHKGDWGLNEVVLDPPCSYDSEVESMNWDGEVLQVKTNRVESLYEAAGKIAAAYPVLSDVLTEKLVAAYYREQGNLERLLDEVMKTPDEIPYEMLLAVYEAAEEMADTDTEGNWFWDRDFIFTHYRHPATKKFHVAILTIREFIAGQKARVE